jgi:hypothetical protein
MIEKGRTLICEEGLVLTNGSIIVKEVSLGDWDKPENWWEITEAEAETIMAEKEATELPE